MTIADLSPPESKISALRTILLVLLEEHEHDGALPTSARFLYYELVQRGQLSSPPPDGRGQNMEDGRNNSDVRWSERPTSDGRFLNEETKAEARVMTERITALLCWILLAMH